MQTINYLLTSLAGTKDYSTILHEAGKKGFLPLIEYMYSVGFRDFRAAFKHSCKQIGLAGPVFPPSAELPPAAVEPNHLQILEWGIMHDLVDFDELLEYACAYIKPQLDHLPTWPFLDWLVGQAKSAGRTINYDQAIRAASRKDNAMLLDSGLPLLMNSFPIHYADQNQPQNLHYTEQILLGACQGGHQHLIDFAIKRGAANFNEALLYAGMGGQRAVADFLIEQGATEINNMLWGAAQCGSIITAQWAVLHNAMTYDIAMNYASKQGDQVMMEWLVQRQRDVLLDKPCEQINGCLINALFHACLLGHQLLAKWIISQMEGNPVLPTANWFTVCVQNWPPITTMLTQPK